MSELERKELAALEIKDADKGEVEAVFATLNVVDRDEDVIVDGALVDGQKAKLSEYAHNSITDDKLPVGTGSIHVKGDKAIFTGRYFLKTARGREAFETIKEMGRDQEWSFGFQVLGSEVPDDGWKKKGARRIITKLSVFEVSPVLVGAGIGTRTLAAKAADEEAARAAAEAEAARLAAEETVRLAAETKAAAELRARGAVCMDEYLRTQRTLKRLGLV